MSENFNEQSAAAKADRFIYLILQHQPRLVSESGLVAGSGGEKLAQQIAALRKTLIEELQKQPFAPLSV